MSSDYFCIVESVDKPVFEEQCNFKLRMGWRLHGILNISTNEHGVVRYIQAFIK